MVCTGVHVPLGLTLAAEQARPGDASQLPVNLLRGSGHRVFSRPEKQGGDEPGAVDPELKQIAGRADLDDGDQRRRLDLREPTQRHCRAGGTELLEGLVDLSRAHLVEEGGVEVGLDSPSVLSGSLEARVRIRPVACPPGFGAA